MVPQANTTNACPYNLLAVDDQALRRHEKAPPLYGGDVGRAREDSNLRPLAPQANALSTELRAQMRAGETPERRRILAHAASSVKRDAYKRPTRDSAYRLPLLLCRGLPLEVRDADAAVVFRRIHIRDHLIPPWRCVRRR